MCFYRSKTILDPSILFWTGLKVSKSQKHFFLKLHCPQNERNIWQNSALIGQWSLMKKYFWDLLTFLKVQMFKKSWVGCKFFEVFFPVYFLLSMHTTAFLMQWNFPYFLSHALVTVGCKKCLEFRVYVECTCYFTW